MTRGTRHPGRVLEASGAPAAGALVAVEWSDVPVPEVALVADADGGFVLFLPAGRFRIAAHARGRRATVEVEAPREEDIEIVLPGSEDGAAS
ncbi:MAG: carboxypeptidase-like regulatory domain-containing protein [Sandaracinaceae bacterium]